MSTMRCEICRRAMPDIGYGEGLCHHCGAKHSYEECVSVVLDREMREAVKAVLLARKAKRRAQ